MNKAIPFILLFLPSIAMAQPEGFTKMMEEEVFKRKVKERANSIETIKADFVQEKHMDILEEPMKSKGEFYFKKESSVRWEYNSPYHYVVVIDDGKLSINDEGKSTQHDMQGNETFEKINELMIKSVKGDVSGGDEFVASYFQSDEEKLVILKPSDKEVKGFLSSIHLFFDASDHKVERVKMVEPSGDRTLIEFKEQKFNEAISDEVFELPGN